MGAMQERFDLEGTIVDLHSERLFDGVVTVRDGRIQTIKEQKLSNGRKQFIMPGFIDAHVHIESSMLTPSAFARQAVVHGTVAVVADPHEIANVCGLAGVHYMIEDARRVPFKFYFGAPSCVPASTFETAGAELTEEDIRSLFALPEVVCLAEMMNYPGVINGDLSVLAKLRAAEEHGLPVDGHAPGLHGEMLSEYASRGITTDHESSTYSEAVAKLSEGVKIWMREGSAARNLEALYRLIEEFPGQVAFCSDDLHPDAMAAGLHIRDMVARVTARGIDRLKAYIAATRTPKEHYGLDVGTLQEGDPADLIVTDDLSTLNIRRVYINGELVAEDGVSRIDHVPAAPMNNFSCNPISAQSLRVPYSKGLIRVIAVEDGELLTGAELHLPRCEQNEIASDVRRDILKLVIVNRYNDAGPSIAFVKNFGLKHGAIASSVAHDSHNLIAVGVDDQSIARALNAIIEEKGGIAVSSKDGLDVLPLPIAGLMGKGSCVEMAEAYQRLDAKAKALGSSLKAPFMTLSFLALPVIPHLKLTDRGLFHAASFSHVKLIHEG